MKWVLIAYTMGANAPLQEIGRVPDFSSEKLCIAAAEKFNEEHEYRVRTHQQLWVFANCYPQENKSIILPKAQ